MRGDGKALYKTARAAVLYVLYVLYVLPRRLGLPKGNRRLRRTQRPQRRQRGTETGGVLAHAGRTMEA